VIYHLYHLEQHASLLVQDPSFVSICSQGAENLPVDGLETEFSCTLLVHVLAGAGYTILEEPVEDLFVGFE